MKYYIKTYGCQMNYSDSERIAGVLELAGYQKTLSEDKADLIVINACSVRKSAVDRISGNFKKYKKYKKKNPKLKIVLTGCVLESDKKRFEKLFDSVIDIKEMHLLGCHCEGAIATEAIPELQFDEPNKGIASLLTVARNDNNYFNIKPQYQSKFSAYVPIMTGCNNFCSYCVVPYTRGREYSRPVEEIIGEIIELVNKGYKEIILLGQNVNSYESRIKNNPLCHSALDAESSITLNFSINNNPNNNSNPTNWIPASAGMTGMVNFPTLLKLINNIPGNFWIRFLTSHPKDITEELIKTVAKCDKCTEYIHLALQSGDDEILKKMNRKYTAKHFLNLIKMIRKYISDVAITTDIIVGFPGETKKQFQNTAKVMKKAKFDMAYINKYSPRAGTASAKLKDDIEWQEKKRREKVLTEILKETVLENNKKYVGKVIDVLIYESGIKNQESGIIYGKTKSFKNVKIKTGIRNRELRIKGGKFVKIKIIKARFWNLEGEVIK
jgi:tRNA-2-methylthio-N6-dimethylallyladenosine synthase